LASSPGQAIVGLGDRHLGHGHVEPLSLGYFWPVPGMLFVVGPHGANDKRFLRQALVLLQIDPFLTG